MQQKGGILPGPEGTKIRGRKDSQSKIKGYCKKDEGEEEEVEEEKKETEKRKQASTTTSKYNS